MGPYKPLRNWVDFPIPYYMEIAWEFRLDPATHRTSNSSLAGLIGDPIESIKCPMKNGGCQPPASDM